MMIQEPTNHKDIFRYDDVIPNHVCDLLVDYTLSLKETKQVDTRKLPWMVGDSLCWTNIKNDYLFARVESHREVCTFLISFCFGEMIYPIFTDIVLWRTKMSMAKHVDDGSKIKTAVGPSKNIINTLKPRKYSLITYLNDDYIGGETVIHSNEGEYISYPKKGSVVFFKSNFEHGVNTIESGIRVTLPIWFTDQKDKQEIYTKR